MGIKFVVICVCIIFAAFFAFLAITPLSNLYLYYRVLFAGGSLLLTAIVALISLGQYQRNSRNKRIECSMSFWRRANSEEFTKNHDVYVKLCREADRLESQNLADYVVNNEDNKTLPIEYLLDFWDEAATGVLMGACDGEAIYCYLGSLMLRHAKKLKEFRDAWRKEHRRPEKWNAFEELVKQWKTKKPPCRHWYS